MDALNQSEEEKKKTLQDVTAQVFLHGSSDTITIRTSPQVVAIVGAGASGIAAAHKLLKKGYDVVIFEAYDVLGGRARTKFDLGVPFDHGCQWLHDDLWEDEAKELGVKVETKVENPFYFVFDQEENFFSSEFASYLTDYLKLVKGQLEENSDLEIAEQIIDKNLENIKVEFTKNIRIQIETKINKKVREESKKYNDKVDEEIKSEEKSYEKQAVAEFDEKKLEEKYKTELLSVAIDKIVSLKNIQPKERRFVRDKVKDVNQLNDYFNVYELNYEKVKLELEEEAKKKAIDKRKNTLIDEEKKKRKINENQIEEKVSQEAVNALKSMKLDEKISNIYLPFSKAMVGCFEESIEVGKFSVVDMRDESDDDESSGEDNFPKTVTNSAQDEFLISNNSSGKSLSEQPKKSGNKVPKGGYGALICACGEELQKTYSNKLTIYYKTAVNSIKHGGNTVNITTSSEVETVKNFKCDAVIVTASTAVMVSDIIKFEPEIPEIINKFKLLPLGSYKKIGIKFNLDIFDEYFKNKNPKEYNHIEDKFECEFFTYCRDVTNTNFIWKIQMQLPGSNVVLMIAAGEFAEFLDKNDKIAETYAINQLCSMVGEKLVKENFSKISMTNWTNDIYVKGAYSYTVEGGAKARNYLKNTCISNKIFFAGEALWKDEYGSAHAALQSGQYAAQKAIKKLEEKK